MRRILHFTTLYLAACGLFASLHAFAAEEQAAPLPPVTQRFAAEEVAEEPSFQKHVVPLFGRLGCNGRACHGSFAGQGGFQLSLFGYDFKADHAALFKDDRKRANVEKPLDSLIIKKPISDDDHEGGKRYDKGGWEYQILRRWIESGAKFDAAKIDKLATLEVTPAEIVFAGADANTPLRAIAVWVDGTREDVTPLCRFVSNSDQIAKVNIDGVVTSKDAGDTHIVVSYDKAVVAVPVLRAASEKNGDQYPQVATRTQVDRLVVDKLRKLGVVPSDVCTDAEFLRRVSLDLAGTLPSAREVEEFIASSSLNKRAEKIDELLETPAYAAWWATKFCDITGNNDQQLNNTGGPRGTASRHWYDWIYKRIAENAPYDEIAEGIVTAVSRKPGESYYDYCAEMSKINQKDSGVAYADRPHMPYYWARNNVRQPEEKAIAFAYTFMGLRIQCAQCHKHPFDVWSKDDFESFKGFFTRMKISAQGAPGEGTKEEYARIMKELGVDPSLKGGNLDKVVAEKVTKGAIVPFPEIHAIPPKAVAKNPKKDDKDSKKNRVQTAFTARLLGTEETLDLNQSDDPRVPLFDWLRSAENPYFARAFVNRVWANYFNVGIVEPPDDMSLGNPPSNAALLDHLTNGFVERKFDMKWLHREICNSDAYQRSWKANATNEADERNFSRAVVRRLPAEVVYDALQRATASDERSQDMLSKIEGRAIHQAGSNAGANAGGSSSFALKVFGRSIRESNCDCDRSMEASLLQTVYLQNDADILNAVSPTKGTWMAQLDERINGPAKKKDDAKEKDKLKETQREIIRAKLRIDQAKKGGDADKIKRLEERLAELERQLPETKPATEPAPAKSPVETAVLVREAYLRTVSREPTPAELDRSLQFIASAETPIKGLRDVMWALLNTKEFVVNH